MSYQVIRGAIEMATASALVDAGIDKVFFDNVGYGAPDAATSFAEIAVSFTDVKQDVIGCLGVDDFGGTATVYINTQVGQGARQGEEFALAVLRAWTNSAAINGFLTDAGHVRMRNLDGPRLINGDESTSHQQHTVSAAFRGRIGDVQNGSGGGSGGTDVNTREVKLTNPDVFAAIETSVITPPTGYQTQEDANQWFVDAIDELDEAIENVESPSEIDAGDY